MTTKGADGRSSIHRRADGNGWEGWVSFGVDANGKRRRKHVRGTTKAAVAEKIKALERQRAGGYVGGTAVTVETWLDTWTAARHVRPKTREGYRTDRNHIVRAIGNIRLDKLTPEHVEGLWRSILAGGAGPATVAHVRRTLGASMRTAVERGYLARNPVALAETPRYETPEVHPLSREESGRLISVMSTERNGSRWAVAFLGLRQGEALGLTWDKVDLDAGRLTVDRQLQWPRWEHGCGGRCSVQAVRCPDRHSGGPTLVDTKSRAGRRTIGLPAPMVEMLREHRRAQVAERMAAGSLWTDWDLVFASELGHPIRKEFDSDHWHAALERAGIPRRTLHSARHSAATLLLAMGLSASVVGQILGHSDVRATGRYAHLVDEIRDDAADRLSVALWG